MRIQLEERYNKLCVICLEDTSDPNRDDGLCSVCGALADKYEQADEIYPDHDDDCGC